jgi:hypothetical protein
MKKEIAFQEAAENRGRIRLTKITPGGNKDQ